MKGRILKILEKHNVFEGDYTSLAAHIGTKQNTRVHVMRAELADEILTGINGLTPKQGEGAKERYEKAVSFSISSEGQALKVRDRFDKALRIAAGYTDKQ